MDADDLGELDPDAFLSMHQLSNIELEQALDLTKQNAMKGMMMPDGDMDYDFGK